MNTYFFSYHASDPKMIKNLGATITTQSRVKLENFTLKMFNLDDFPLIVV